VNSIEYTGRLGRVRLWLRGFYKVVIFVHLCAVETRYAGDVLPGSRSERTIWLVPSVEHLKQAFQEHLEQTKGHVQRLEEIFQALGKNPRWKKCARYGRLIKEGQEAIEEDYEGAVKDAALISAAQRVEHYEIAAYGTAKALAEVLGESDHASKLEETLDEEKETDEQVNEEANTEEEGEEDEEEATSKSRSKSRK